MEKGFYEYARYGSTGISWVLASCIYFYICYTGGGWLDRQWGTKPIFLTCGLILAMAMSIGTLFRLVLAAEKSLREEKAARSSPENDEPGA